jgi:hypothetical protein
MLVGGWTSASISGRAALLTRFAHMEWWKTGNGFGRSPAQAMCSRRTGDGACEDPGMLLGFSDFVILVS